MSEEVRVCALCARGPGEPGAGEILEAEWFEPHPVVGHASRRAFLCEDCRIVHWSQEPRDARP